MIINEIGWMSQGHKWLIVCWHSSAAVAAPEWVNASANVDKYIGQPARLHRDERTSVHSASRKFRMSLLRSTFYIHFHSTDSLMEASVSDIIHVGYTRWRKKWGHWVMRHGETPQQNCARISTLFQPNPRSLLTLWRPLLPYGYTYKAIAVPDRVKPSFVIFDNRALWRSVLRVRVPGCQKLQMTA